MWRLGRVHALLESLKLSASLCAARSNRELTGAPKLLLCCLGPGRLKGIPSTSGDMATVSFKDTAFS